MPLWSISIRISHFYRLLPHLIEEINLKNKFRPQNIYDALSFRRTSVIENEVHYYIDNLSQKKLEQYMLIHLDPYNDLLLF